MSASQAAVWIVGSLVLGLLVPVGFVAMLAPKLAESDSACRTNYRGERVFLGLGIVWLVWAGCALLSGALIGVLGVPGPFSAGVLVLAGPLALVAFSLGMVDDALGSADDRGFRGHIAELLHGRMTTGMLKLIGISLASLICAAALSSAAPWGAQTAFSTPLYVAAIVAAGAAIALTSNLVNLTDLRPGRALKVYSILGVAGALMAASFVGDFSADGSGGFAFSRNDVVGMVVLLLFALGPVVAVWRYDVGERGMLGDAGANPMGAVAGLLIVAGLPWWGLVAYLVFVLALNLMAERVSFSKIIDGSETLSRLDRAGRSSDGIVVRSTSRKKV